MTPSNHNHSHNHNNTEQPRGRVTLASIINGWWNRLFAAVFGGRWDDQPWLYESGRSGRDYLLNTLGSIAWGTLFPLLTIVATQLSGAERAGHFTMAFTTATLLLYVGNYGVKTYQVSDLEETESFSSYRTQRLMTCLLMLAIGFLYCLVRGYSKEMWLISAGAYGFRAVDALADTYEARLQQQDKLYLAGISQAVRSVLGITAFSLLLLVTKSLVTASIGMAVAALASFFLLTAPLTRLETPRPRPGSAIEVREIFTDCFPTFLALFLFALIESIPKYAMEGVLPYRSQVFFSAIYFPAQAMLMVVGFIYRPQLVRLATIWGDERKRLRFDLIVVAMIAVCVLVTGVGLAFAHWLAVPMNTLLYGTSFEPYRNAQYLMVIAGGLSAAIDFLYQIITVLRQQATATRIYLGATVFVTGASIILVRLYGFDGAVWSYLGVMGTLFFALGIHYIFIRTQAA
ncbi:MAG: lipopolysaccharide biosynthesis protein [Coriobacteriales bacterium]|nr:lipopolysaccharide biosynthesis protein [Coriobacteriales bacterium]